MYSHYWVNSTHIAGFYDFYQNLTSKRLSKNNLFVFYHIVLLYLCPVFEYFRQQKCYKCSQTLRKHFQLITVTTKTTREIEKYLLPYTNNVLNVTKNYLVVIWLNQYFWLKNVSHAKKSARCIVKHYALRIWNVLYFDDEIVLHYY